MKIQMYNNPALYNACTNHKIDDIPFYQYWAKEANGSILELACGTGRVAKPLLDKGYNYTGLDLSPVFIDHCKSKYPNGQFITSDMRDFNLGQKFDLISIPFNSFLHLYTEDEMNRCLKSAQNHLAKNGQFLLDIFVPDPEFLYRDPNKRYEEMTITHPQGGECIIWQKNQYDEDTEINHIHWFFDRGNGGPQDEDEFDMRMIYPDTMDRLLTDSGFTIEEKWGDYDGEAFDETSLLQLYICSRRL
ncbi:MAG: class I SAM-dependent methyltransferase [Candidatus Marinimicrobia bacterium]|jgi:SAM-dependent methyltransferase|nr:class I SAM-dependent methyltransferase [Candidatus Neomarinimicrobiota bacterium]MBT3675525.1 class I SAM-dependent methyltransferase [Candidatus Neomarinimicrobiota bacterium]MBT3764154.1 class I SAM-dependent methyltransferase [Candidatus Neomarinimicrobiota bacterium]MBT4067736.1 class I SAM-dependent methyltransferase [Candidatus Neomarinimicrobiota bacterium]MBT4271604.1 class I SAM-dependent methyltransferase [Candidatus Neomarinimicrobiota bacterium]